jgi:hypothetical protein
MKIAIWCYFPFSAGISPHGRYQPHGQWRQLEVDATGRDRVYGWLSVGYRHHVSGVSRPGRVGHSDPQRPSTGSISRHVSRIAGYRISPVRLGHVRLRQYCLYASFETRNQIITPQTELNSVVLCPKLSSLLLG